MEQEDYLKRQIDQLGRVLGKTLTSLLGLKNSGPAAPGLEIVHQSLKEALDLDIGAIIQMKTEDLIQTLTSEKNLTPDHLDQLAEILFLLADHMPEKDQKSIYEKSLAIYEHLEQADKTYSLDRQMKIERLKKLL